MRLTNIAIILCVAGCGTNVGGTGSSRSTGPSSARQICVRMGTDELGNTSDVRLNSGFTADALTEEIELGAGYGLTRLETFNWLLASCGTASSEAGTSFCMNCGMAVVDEVYENHVPAPRDRVRSVCRSALLLESQIDAVLSMAQVSKDEGNSISDFLSSAEEDETCNDRCHGPTELISENWSEQRCVALCNLCLMTVADEVW